MSSRSTTERARRAGAAGLLALCFGGVAFVGAPAVHATAGDTVSFAFIGDVPYTSSQTILMNGLTASVNGDPDVQFVAHSGDFKGGSDLCSDSAFQSTFNSFQQFSDPFWYTPGDNDWTDCHRNSNGNYQPADRLAKVRSLYFSTPGQTTGGAPMTVTSQAIVSGVRTDREMVENTYFNSKCVTFGDIHSVSSNQGYLDPNYVSTLPAGSSGYTVETPTEKTARYAEVDARIAADVRWIDAIFAAADANSSDAVFLMMQAEPLLASMLPGGVPDNDKVFGTEFVAIRAEILAQTDAHPNMQVVIAHGDQHNHLWEPGYGGVAHPNLARLENWGSATGGILAVQRWQKVTVTCNTPGTKATFAVADQVVAVVPPAQVPEGHLALGLAGMAAAGGGVLLIRSRRGKHRVA